MSCCRGRAKAVYSQQDPSACKTIEHAGSGLKLWVMPSQGGYHIVTSINNTFVDIATFISGYNCGGPTCKTVMSHVNRIQQAAAINPGAFTRNASGSTLPQIIKIADSILKNKG